MGYTHYARLDRAGPQEKWAAAVMAARQIIEASPVPLADGLGEGDGPSYRDDGIYVNGVGCDGCETLVVPTVLSALESQPWLNGMGDGRYLMFCKTRQLPYDIVVTAVYAALYAIAGPECLSVSSDGAPSDWTAGCMLASSVLGRDIRAPRRVLAAGRLMAASICATCDHTRASHTNGGQCRVRGRGHGWICPCKEFKERS